MAGSVDGVNGPPPSYGYGTHYIVDEITTDPQQEEYRDGGANTGEKISEIGQHVGGCISVFNPVIGGAVVAFFTILRESGLSGGKGKG